MWLTIITVSIVLLVILRIYVEVWIRCRKCGKRFHMDKWLQWHQVGEDDYDGYTWCPNCKHKKWEGFQDRVFG